MCKHMGVRKQQNRYAHTQNKCVFPSFHEVPELQNTGCEGTVWRVVTLNFMFLSSSLDFAAGQLEVGYWASWIFGVTKSSCSSFTEFRVVQTNHSCLSNLQMHVLWSIAWLTHSRNVKSKWKKIVCMLYKQKDGKTGDSWYPGLTLSWSLVLPLMQVSWIWCELRMAQESPHTELTLSKSHSQNGRSGCP